MHGREYIGGKFLVDRGADIESATKCFLVELGANLKAKDKDGVNPYQLYNDLIVWLQEHLSESNRRLAASEQKINALRGH